jgi:hypothetical protein
MTPKGTYKFCQPLRLYLKINKKEPKKRDRIMVRSLVFFSEWQIAHFVIFRWYILQGGARDIILISYL